MPHGRSNTQSGGRPGLSLPDLRPPGRSALLVTGAYVLAAVVWLGFSGTLISTVPSEPLREWLLANDRWLFAAVTGLVLLPALWLELRRRAAPIRQLHVAYDRLSRLVERTPLALVEFDRELRVSRWTAAAERLFGWSAREAEGHAWLDWEIVHEEERDSLERFLAGLGSRAPGGALLVQRNVHRNGEEIWCEWYVSWLRDAGGNVRSVLALVNDITPDREAMSRMQDRNRDLEVRIGRRTRELTAAQRDLRAFTSSLANDLRQPVRAVIGFAENLRAGIGDEIPSEARRQLVYLMAAGRQLDHLIEDLLEYARLGVRETAREPVELVQSARAAVRRLEERFPEAVSVVSLPRSAVTFPGDPELVERVLANLFENALQYRDPHRPPKVTIHVGWTDTEVKVRIQDNGTGIPPEHRERVFRLFERLQSRETHPGSGMGLAIVRKSMDLMGGTVTVEEQGGPGTTFLLRFPTRGDSLDVGESGHPGEERSADADAGVTDAAGDGDSASAGNGDRPATLDPTL